MTNRRLILSIFPGIDLLGLAFGQEWPDACVVRGPDPIFGSLHDIRDFHPPAGVFDGICGGPPCQYFSRLARLNARCGTKTGNLIPEFERVVSEAQPDWFVMENVPEAPEPVVSGYIVHSLLLNNRWLQGEDGIGAAQNRVRRFSFGTRDGRKLDVELALFESPLTEPAVTGGAARVSVKIGGSGKVKKTYKPPAVHGGHSEPFGAPGYSIQEACELQGLPPDFADELPFTVHGKRKAIGNAVPLFMGRAIAKAVRKAML